MIDKRRFFGIGLMELRSLIARRADKPAHHAIDAAREYRRILEGMSGSSTAQVEKLLADTGLTENATTYELVDSCITLWWDKLVPHIHPVVKKPRSTKSEMVARVRRPKTEKVYYALFCIHDTAEYKHLVSKWDVPASDAKFPYLTLRGKKFELEIKMRSVSVFPIKSDLVTI